VPQPRRASGSGEHGTARVRGIKPHSATADIRRVGPELQLGRRFPLLLLLLLLLLPLLLLLLPQQIASAGTARDGGVLDLGWLGPKS
jgi:hypothetical protein